jgi:hypothetical protein
VLDDPKEVLGIGLFSEGIDVNTTDEAELARASSCWSSSWRRT